MRRLSDVVRELAKRPQGFTTTDPLLESFGTPSRIGNNFAHLVRSGEIIAVRLSSRSAIYFGSRQHADAWMLRTNHAPWNVSKSYADRAELQHRAPLRDEVPTMAPDVKITACPAFVPRFQPVSVLGAPRVYYGAVGRVQ